MLSVVLKSVQEEEVDAHTLFDMMVVHAGVEHVLNGAARVGFACPHKNDANKVEPTNEVNPHKSRKRWCLGNVAIVRPQERKLG